MLGRRYTAHERELLRKTGPVPKEPSLAPDEAETGSGGDDER